MLYIEGVGSGLGDKRAGACDWNRCRSYGLEFKMVKGCRSVSRETRSY